MATIRPPSSLETLFLVARRFLLGAPKFRYVGAGHHTMTDGYVLDAIPMSMIPPPPARRRPQPLPLHQELSRPQLHGQVLQNPLPSTRTTFGVVASRAVPATTTSATALAAAASTALIANNTHTSTMPVSISDDFLPDDSVLSSTYTLETIDPNRVVPVPYWYDSPHFRPDV